jgi:ribonuclease P protein component
MDRYLSFGKEHRIRAPHEYKEIISRGSRIATSRFTLFILTRGDGEKRIGVSVGKRVGNAAKRNRIKRLVREAFRTHKNRISPGTDMVVIVRRISGKEKLSNVVEELSRGLEKRGKWISCEK